MRDYNIAVMRSIFDLTLQISIQNFDVNYIYHFFFVGISIEELIEEKRAELSAQANLTPVTLESFVKWKKRKLAEKAEADKKEADKKKDRAKAGLTVGLSGRDMFSFNPTMAGGDDDDEDGGEAFDMKLREKDEGDDDGVQVKA